MSQAQYRVPSGGNVPGSLTNISGRSRRQRSLTNGCLSDHLSDDGPDHGGVPRFARHVLSGPAWERCGSTASEVVHTAEAHRRPSHPGRSATDGYRTSAAKTTRCHRTPVVATFRRPRERRLRPTATGSQRPSAARGPPRKPARRAAARCIWGYMVASDPELLAVPSPPSGRCSDRPRSKRVTARDRSGSLLKCTSSKTTDVTVISLSQLLELRESRLYVGFLLDEAILDGRPVVGGISFPSDVRGSGANRLPTRTRRRPSVHRNTVKPHLPRTKPILNPAILPPHRFADRHHGVLHRPPRVNKRLAVNASDHERQKLAA